MNKRLFLYVGSTLAVLLVVASVVMFLMNIWIPDNRWGQTGFILLCTGVASGFAAGMSQI